jgi:hypothetical protein
MADKHYTKVPQELLDQAVTWLGQEYGFIERPDAAKPQNSEVQPGASDASSPEPDVAEPDADQESKARSSRAGRRSKAALKRPAATATDTADSGG